jgi:multidrug efflux system outer membrane protein
MSARLFSSTLAAGVLLALGACTLAPAYERPAAPVAAEFRGSTAASPASSTAADIGWREFFRDPELKRLIERALESNRDLRIAALNAEEAQARYRIRRAALVPGLDAELGGSAQRVPAVISQTGADYTARQYEVGAGFTAFELDLFGRIRSLRNAALEQFLALEETRAATELSLVAAVANAWLALAADEELLRLTRETLESQRSSLALTQLRFDSGVAREIDVRQAEIAVHQAEVNLARYTRQLEEDRNALELLIGEPLPADFTAGGRTLDGALYDGELPAGLPADLLARRPDIRAAEHALRAANADIGAARAAFFPRITLTGFGGLAHSELSDLFDDGGRTWSFVPTLTAPIFARGANRASLDAAEVRKRIEVARYEQAIQTAFREVSDALAAQRTLDEQLAAQRALADSAAAAYSLAEMRYRAGIDSYLTTLIAQRDTYNAQLALVDTALARAANLVRLYKTLGGGAFE